MSRYLKQNRKLLEEMAIKYELPEHVVVNIINHQFEFIAKIMGRKENESITIKGLGRFRVIRKKWKLELKNRKELEATAHIRNMWNEPGSSPISEE